MSPILGPSQQEDTKVTIAGIDVAVAKVKLSIDKINHAQYIEGSLRILREMILQDSLPTQQVVNHVNYLIQVACLAQTNQWQRVLQYDTTYRKEQHEHGFAWGTTSAFLLNSHLVPNHGAAKNAPKKTHTTNPRTNKTVCYSFNGRVGCNRANCRFDHVCLTCFSPSHSQLEHKENHQGKN